MVIAPASRMNKITGLNPVNFTDLFLVVSHIVPARVSNHMGNCGDTAKLK